jgi:pimeloyl-ACP methyl ester carboxylesterase
MALYVDEAGPRDAPAIVFLHGGGVGGWMWQPQVEAFRGDYHCLVPDLPEHRHSVAEGPLTMENSAVRIAELIRARAPGGRAHVVGLSLGGQIVVQLLAAAPEVVDHAVISGALVRPYSGLQVSLITATLKLYWPLRKVGFLVRGNMKAAAIPERFFAEAQADLDWATPAILGRIFAAGLRFTIPAGLNRVAAPTLVAVGQREQAASITSARDLVAAIPSARGCVAPNAGHTWNLQAPDLFNRAVRAWIEDQPLPPELLPLV